MQITDVSILYNVINIDHPPVETGLDIGWISPYGGFGRCVISVDEDGKVQIDNKYMDKSHFLEVMSALYNMADVI